MLFNLKTQDLEVFIILARIITLAIRGSLNLARLKLTLIANPKIIKIFLPCISEFLSSSNQKKKRIAEYLLLFKAKF